MEKCQCVKGTQIQMMGKEARDAALRLLKEECVKGTVLLTTIAGKTWEYSFWVRRVFFVQTQYSSFRRRFVSGIFRFFN